MANIVKISTTVSWTDGKDILKTSYTNTHDQVGTAALEAIQNIGTSIEPINLGDVVPGWVTFINRDITNDVTISSDNAGSNVVAVLTPGEGITIPTTVTAFWGQATGGACNVLVLAFDA